MSSSHAVANSQGSCPSTVTNHPLISASLFPDLIPSRLMKTRLLIDKHSIVSVLSVLLLLDHKSRILTISVLLLVIIIHVFTFSVFILCNQYNYCALVLGSSISINYARPRVIRFSMILKRHKIFLTPTRYLLLRYILCVRLYIYIYISKNQWSDLMCTSYFDLMKMLWQ